MGSRIILAQISTTDHAAAYVGGKADQHTRLPSIQTGSSAPVWGSMTLLQALPTAAAAAFQHLDISPVR